MSDCRTARNGADNVRKLQRALYRQSKQDKDTRFYRLYDKVWRTDVLWEAWQHVKANKGAPGVDGKAIEEMVETGQSIPHRKLVRLMTRWIADGSLLKLIKQTLRVGVKDQGQGVPTTVGVPQGSPISPLSSNIYLNLRDQLWQSRGYPEKLGATLHRDADDAMLVCRRSPQPVLATFEAIAKRMDLTINRDKTHVTRVTDGVDFLGCNFVKRTSPSRGKHTIDIFPAKSAQQKIRSRLKYLTSRRAPMSPQEFVGMVNPRVTGWVNDFRHTNASQAFRGLQRFVNIRFRRYLPQRSQGRGFGWKRFPNRKLSAMGLVDIGSGRLEYTAKPAHGLR